MPGSTPGKRSARSTPSSRIPCTACAARIEVHQILRQAATTDLPIVLAAQVRDADLSDADRSLVIVLRRVLDPDAVGVFIDAPRTLPPGAAAVAFERLPANADEPTRHDLAVDLLVRDGTARASLAVLWNTTARADTAATRTVDDAVRDLHNPAQSDILRRIRTHLRSRPGHDPVGQVLQRSDVLRR